MATDPQDITADKAVQAREKGNAFYKQGKLAEAEVAYKLASTLAPNDPAPVSNLSAVKFEMGDFEGAATFAAKALSLSENSTHDRKDKLLVRLAKSHLHANNPAAGLEAAEQLSHGAEKTNLVADLEFMLKLNAEGHDPLWERKQVISRLSRYRPCLADVAEYYPVGHDHPLCLFDNDLINRLMSPEAGEFIFDAKVSFLFGGIGDGRNLYETLINTAIYSDQLKTAQRRAFGAGRIGDSRFVGGLHITILDLKAPALAKNLVILDLFTEYHDKKKKGAEKKTLDALTYAMAYIFISVVYPPAVHGVVQESLGRLINAIEAGKPISPWVHLGEQSREPVLYYLKQWKGPAVDEYSNNKHLRAVSTREIQKSDINEFHMLMSLGIAPPMDDEAIPKGCEEDKILAETLNILTPPKDYDTGDGPELRKLLDAFKAKPKSGTKVLDEYIATHWKTNVTQLDLDWERQWKQDNFEGDEMHTAIGFHPVKVAARVCVMVESLRGKRLNTITRLATFFAETVKAAEELIGNSSLVIEAICGELGDVMEKLRFDCYEGRGVSTGRTEPGDGPDVSKFPTTFDRIHLSNITDYVGGPMHPFLYARPLLKALPGVNVRFNNLLNCSSFDSLDQFHAEYTLLPSESAISKQFQLTREPTDPQITNFTQMDYMVWNVAPSNMNKTDKTLNTKLPFKDLPMSRPQLEKWIHAWLLKLCLPYPRNEFDGYAIHSPFNLTLLPRLIIHLHQVVGYPAHWLAGILRTLCTGIIITTARPPSRLVTDTSDLKKVYPANEMNMTPYVAELTTIFGLWRLLIPFGFALTESASITPKEVVECTVLFKGGFQGSNGLRMSRFKIVLWNTGLLGSPPLQLLDLLANANKTEVEKLRKGGIHIVSAFSYTNATQTASFWLREDVVDQVLDAKENWAVYIWRTDTWGKQSEAVKAKDFLVKRRRWVGEDAN
ncbi:hypothetical protein V8F20_009814 [Naviculisporaceae sp. PSN 640]